MTIPETPVHPHTKTPWEREVKMRRSFGEWIVVFGWRHGNVFKGAKEVTFGSGTRSLRFANITVLIWMEYGELF